MTQSLTGQFLVASRHLRDPNFYQSIVLIVEHNSSGAMGLIVNRPSTLTVAKALQGHFELPETETPVFTGGPVEKAALFILHNSAQYDGNESPIVPGLFVGNSVEVFEEIVQVVAAGEDDSLKYRIFAGCAGWAPRQLENEIERGDWYLQPATAELIFDEDPYSVWSRLCQSAAERGFSLPAPATSASWN